MESEEVEFLKDQVQRLSASLSKYVSGTLDDAPLEGPLAQEGPTAPWLTNHNVLSPLIAEYDQQLNQLQQEVDLYREEIGNLRPELDRIVSENNLLSAQLKEKLDNHLAGVSVDTEGSDYSPTTENEQVLHNLQTQADSALQEKEAAISRWQEADHEIDRLQRQLQSEKDSHQWKVVEQQAHKMQTEYYETVGVLNKELEDTQQDLRLTKQELEATLMQNKDLKKSNKDLEQQLQWKDQEIADILFKEGVSDSRVGDMKRILDNLQQKLTSVTKELDSLKMDKEGLEARVKEMQKRNGELEAKEVDAVTQVRDAVQMVENAVLEKEQAEVEVKQREEEIEKLQDSINKLINEAGIRTRQEVDHIRQQSNERISKLTEELHSLEMESAEKSEMLQRAIREKRMVEVELEKSFKDSMTQAAKEKDAFEDLNRRAVNAERSRDDNDVKLDTLQNELRRQEMNNEQLKSQYETQFIQMTDRMKQMENEFEHLNDDRVRLQNEADEMKKSVSSANKEKEFALRKYQKEMTILENEQQQKMQDYEVRLQSSEDANRHAMGELRKLLTGQQRMSAKWKEECETITKKFEVKINDTRTEMSHVRRRNDELTTLLRDSQAKTMEAEKMITDYARNIYRMEERVRESETRASEATKQLSRQSVRQRQIQSERRSLMNELQRSTAGSPNRSARFGDSMVIAELSTGHRTLDNSALHESKFKGEQEDALSDR
ncbi:sodium channel and clathrin linker 1-like isoform X1 [Pecten maximus]|uniref:sodium channel and clathrin linker 1-like isoform X1 n=1 Tax=Pecten maximus TaxID=6579 RepID=UPI001458E944|nr:sodium channel and clathrin linker 1-like isoform X1 [Pecten maximus]